MNTGLTIVKKTIRELAIMLLCLIIALILFALLSTLTTEGCYQIYVGDMGVIMSAKMMWVHFFTAVYFLTNFTRQTYFKFNSILLNVMQIITCIVIIYLASIHLRQSYHLYNELRLLREANEVLSDSVNNRIFFLWAFEIFMSVILIISLLKFFFSTKRARNNVSSVNKFSFEEGDTSDI